MLYVYSFPISNFRPPFFPRLNEPRRAFAYIDTEPAVSRALSLFLYPAIDNDLYCRRALAPTGGRRGLRRLTDRSRGYLPRAGAGNSGAQFRGSIMITETPVGTTKRDI